MSKLPSLLSLKNSADGNMIARLMTALDRTVDEGRSIVHIDSSIVPSSVMSAAEIYRLTHKWEQNREEIANRSGEMINIAERIYFTRPDSSGQVVDGV